MAPTNFAREYQFSNYDHRRAMSTLLRPMQINPSSQYQIIEKVFQPKALRTYQGFKVFKIPNRPNMYLSVETHKKCSQISKDDLFKFDHDPVPFLEQMLAEADPKEFMLFEYDIDPTKFLEKLLEEGDVQIMHESSKSDLFPFDHDPVAFLEKMLAEADPKEFDILFEYDLDPVEFLEKILEEGDVQKIHGSSKYDELFTFDHDPVPFLETLLADADALLKEITPYDPDDTVFDDDCHEYNGETMCFYNKTFTDVPTWKPRRKRMQKVSENQRINTYVKSRTFIHSKYHRKNKK